MQNHAVCLSGYKRLVKSIGHHSARQEVQWMVQSIQSQRGMKKNTSSTCNRHQGPLCGFVQRRSVDEPLQYILGNTPFGSLSIKTRKPVMIPRVETEEWTINLANLLSNHLETNRPLKILDLCTGSGCILLLLCHLLPSGTVDGLAVDKSTDACRLANENSVATGFHHSGRKDFGQHRNVVRVIQADMLNETFPELVLSKGSKFDVITCNPPYISYKQYLDLPRSVRDFEDSLALVGEMQAPRSSASPLADGSIGAHDGLAYFHMLQKLVPQLLKPKGGIFATEFGFSHSEQIRAILGQPKLFETFEIWKDAWGSERVAVGIT